MTLVIELEVAEADMVPLDGGCGSEVPFEATPPGPLPRSLVVVLDLGMRPRLREA